MCVALSFPRNKTSQGTAFHTKNPFTPPFLILRKIPSNRLRYTFTSMAAASMATSMVSKAVLFPSNDTAAAAVFSSKRSYLKFHGKTAAGRSYRGVGGRRIGIQVVAMSSPTPAKDNISEIVEESIKTAIETCADNETSGECAASWDTVEELSATRSHMRTKEKAKDPLEEFCKDNPETDECRTYED